MQLQYFLSWDKANITHSCKSQLYIKDVSEKVKALAKSKKAMKEELTRLQEDLENMTEDELQSFNLIKIKEQTKFQESTAIIAN